MPCFSGLWRKFENGSARGAPRAYVDAAAFGSPKEIAGRIKNKAGCRTRTVGRITLETVKYFLTPSSASGFRGKLKDRPAAVLVAYAGAASRRGCAV